MQVRCFLDRDLWSAAALVRSGTENWRRSKGRCWSRPEGCPSLALANMRGRRHADLARHKSAAFLTQREELRNLLIPFNEDLLSKNAPKALELLKQQPDLLDADIIHDLVEEKPKKKLEEGAVGRCDTRLRVACTRNAPSSNVSPSQPVAQLVVLTHVA